MPYTDEDLAEFMVEQMNRGAKERIWALGGFHLVPKVGVLPRIPRHQSVLIQPSMTREAWKARGLRVRGKQ